MKFQIIRVVAFYKQQVGKVIQKPTRCNKNSFIDLQDQLNMFRVNFAHLQERKTEVFYNIWYSVLLLWQAGVRSEATWHYVYGMKEAA